MLSIKPKLYALITVDISAIFNLIELRDYYQRQQEEIQQQKKLLHTEKQTFDALKTRREKG